MKCNVDGCEKKADTRQMCQMHYIRWYRHGDVNYNGKIAPHTCGAYLLTGVRCSSPKGADLDYCPLHYKMMIKFGKVVEKAELLSVCRTKTPCTEPRCNRSGLCRDHYNEDRKRIKSSGKANLVGRTEEEKEWLKSKPCSSCGWVLGSRDIHHIENFDPKNVQYSNRMENLIPLCPNCHRLVHEGKLTTKSLLELVEQLLSSRGTEQK